MENQGFKHYFKETFKSGLQITYAVPSCFREFWNSGEEIITFDRSQSKKSKGKPFLEHLALETGLSDHALGFRKRIGHAFGFQVGASISVAGGATLAYLSDNYTSSLYPLITVFAVTNYFSVVKEFNNYKNRRKSQSPTN